MTQAANLLAPKLFFRLEFPAKPRKISHARLEQPFIEHCDEQTMMLQICKATAPEG